MKMFTLLILALLRDVAGITFLYHDENATQKLICSKSGPQEKTSWWFTNNSLQTFGRQSYNSTACGGQCNPWAPCHTEGKERDFNCSHSGIVACKNLTDTTPNLLPLFSSEENCRDFDFFIVARTQNKIETNVNSMKTQEENNLILPCQFELKNDANVFAVYWIKETDKSTCLFSASNEVESYTPHTFSYDINCCVDAGIKGRRLNNSTSLDATGLNQSHEITIVNVTSSDSGKYSCIVGVFKPRLAWMIVTIISVNVQQEHLASPGFRYVLELSLGVIGGLFLLSGIILLLCWKKKSKGKPPEIHQRNQNEMEEDDCSPYAISNRNDTGGNEVIYSLATHPGVKPNVVDPKPDSGRRRGDNLQTIYALVDKNRS